MGGREGSVHQTANTINHSCLFSGVTTVLPIFTNIPQVFLGIKKKKAGGFLHRTWRSSYFQKGPQKSGANSQMCLFSGNMKYQEVVVQRSHFDFGLSLIHHFAKVVFSRFDSKQMDVIVLFLPSL